MYYSTIKIEWAGEKNFTLQVTQRTAGVSTAEQARLDGWGYLDQYMVWYPQGGYRARIWVCKEGA